MSLPQSLENELARFANGDPEKVRVAIEALCQMAACLEPVSHASGSAKGEAPETAASATDPEDLAGRTLGHYRLHERLGAGAFGTVYVGENVPTRQKVAIKVLKPGMDTREVLARFDAERQALALMDHPGIARILDAGSTPAGRPYFVMEFVDGEPIQRYCTKHRLDLRARLALFAGLCEAVQHAHQKGVIHRDLSTNNVLVAMVAGKPVPKVIDFGLAKSLIGRLTDKTLHTTQDSVFGTPEFMSPEQAAGSGRDIDTRTDIYALGVILYRLLTDTFPIPSAMVRDVGPTEREQVIRDYKAVRPSAQIAVIKAVPEGIRVTDPATLARKLVGDLDWITMKAIAKERDERYASANELVADVRRHLADETVLAGPPRMRYRMRKLVRRYRWQFAGVLAVLLSLIGGGVSSTVLYFASEENFARYRSLADPALLRELVRQAQDDLWPESEAMAPAMEAWLTDATALLARRGQHERRFAELGGEVQAIRRNDKAGSTGQTPSERPHLTAANALSQAATLAHYLEEVSSDTGLPALVRAIQERLDWSRSVRSRTVDEHQAAWRAAIEDIARIGNYGGLTIRPQVGLVPIGKDPETGLWEFGFLRSGQMPLRGPSGRLELNEHSGVVFVLLPGGRFLIGAQADDESAARYDSRAVVNEKPVIGGTLGPFFISKYELTQSQWLRLGRERNPSRYAPGPDYLATLLHPVEMVSWDACDRLLRNHGLTIPTEAQWEYACRAGTEWPWWTGREWQSIGALGPAVNLCDQIAIAGNVVSEGGGIKEYEDGWVFHAPVDALRPNPFGLHHVLGNVFEWCQDLYGLPSDGAPRRGDGLWVHQQPEMARVVRGGAYNHGLTEVRASFRTGIPSGSSYDNVGVRPARGLDD